MGLELINPLVVGSSALSKTADGVQRLAEAGAGAVVLKSLFEEEIRHQFALTTEALTPSAVQHPDAYEYLAADLATHYGPEEYLRLVENASKAVEIPVIASVNCMDPASWSPYARQLTSAGARALELNVYMLPLDPRVSPEQVDDVYVQAAKAVKREVKIPVAIKLVPYLSNLPRVALQLGEAGVDGLVLFNRTFPPDIDIESMELTGGLSLSSAGEYRLALRWLALLYGRVRCDLCASTGVHDGATLIRMLLAGARAVQVTSALYLDGLGQIRRFLAELTSWMGRHQVESIDHMVGKVSRIRASDPSLLERSQYIRTFVRAE